MLTVGDFSSPDREVITVSVYLLRHLGSGNGFRDNLRIHSTYWTNQNQGHILSK